MNIIVIFPQSNEAKAELARRVAQFHAEHAVKMVQRLTCTSQQKKQLMDAAIAAVTARTDQQ